MNDALDRLVPRSAGQAPTVAAASSLDFIPASSWQGAKAGYYFGTSDKGTGYYRDRQQQQPQQQDGDNNSSNINSRPQKRAKRSVQIAEDRNEIQTIPARQQQQQQALLMLEQAEQEAALSQTKILELTPKGVMSASTSLVRALAKNELQRAEFAPHQPDQYMESEISLFENINALKAIAAEAKQLYPVVLDETDILATMVQLLMHENEDIVSSVVSVLLEWLDPTLLLAEESDHDDNEGTLLVAPIARLAAAVLSDASELLVGNLARIKSNNDNDVDDNDEVGKGTEDILSLIENLLEMDATISSNMQQEEEETSLRLVVDGMSAAAKLCKETTLVSWLFQQVEAGQGLEERALELLAFLAPKEDVYTVLPDWSKIPVFKSILIEEDDDNSPAAKTNGGADKKKKQSLDGVEILLQTVAAYRKKQPSDDPQVESLENACMIMASALTYSPANVQAFLNAQGVELVVRCLKERVHAGATALKWLDFAGSDPIYRRACECMVDAGALKYLFPLFMGRALPKPAPAASVSSSKKLKKEWMQGIEATTIRIMYALTRHLQDDSPNDAKQRLLAKFLDHDKCDRLVELLLSYDQKARTTEYKFYRSDIEETLPDDEAVQLAAMEAKLAGGGDLFHRLGVIAAFCCIGSKRCHERVLSQLRLQQSGISLIRGSLEEFVANLGDGAQKEQIQSYLEHI